MLLYSPQRHEILILTFWLLPNNHIYKTLQLFQESHFKWRDGFVPGGLPIRWIFSISILLFPLTKLFLALQPRWLRSSQLCLSPELWAILQHSYRCYIFSHFHGYKLSRFHHAAAIHPLPPPHLLLLGLHVGQLLFIDSGSLPYTALTSYRRESEMSRHSLRCEGAKSHCRLMTNWEHVSLVSSLNNYF